MIILQYFYCFEGSVSKFCTYWINKCTFAGSLSMNQSFKLVDSSFVKTRIDDYRIIDVPIWKIEVSTSVINTKTSRGSFFGIRSNRPKTVSSNSRDNLYIYFLLFCFSFNLWSHSLHYFRTLSTRTVVRIRDNFFPLSFAKPNHPATETAIFHCVAL